MLKKGVKKEVPAVDVGSLEVGPLSACPSASWILSVEVADIDGSWTTQNDDWVMVGSGAGVSAWSVDSTHDYDWPRHVTGYTSPRARDCPIPFCTILRHFSCPHVDSSGSSGARAGPLPPPCREANGELR